MEYVEFELQNGMIALVDAADWEKIKDYRWRATCNSKKISANWYVKGYHVRTRADGRKGDMFLHRYLLQPKEHELVDHINGNGLDNRRANLRICGAAGNSRNVRKAPGKSNFKGVQRREGKNGVTFQAKICFRDQNIYIGAWATEVEAAVAYDAAALALFGEFARPNFAPEIIERLLSFKDPAACRGEEMATAVLIKHK